MKIAIIGTWHVHTQEYTQAIIDNCQAELTAVWDKDIQKAKAFAKEFGLNVTENYDDILNDKTIDGVVICTATNEHPEIIKKAAKAGKHIFTEKVLAFTKKEAEEICKGVEKFAGKFTICYFHLTLSKLIKLKELCDDGIFGQISYMRVRNVHAGASANWLPPHFYDKNQCGGGAMMDLGAHPMYILNYFLGEPISINSTFTKVTGKAVEDNAVCTIEFKNGAIGVSETGFVSHNFPYTVEISGTDGCAIISGDELKYTSKSTNDKWITCDLPQDMPRPIHLWIDAVVNDTDAPFGTKSAIGLSNLMEGAYISYEKGIKYIY
ncbi:MAG: Gfo/Idh/MocA family oxidoreductase [Clostridia bacterium]